MPGLAALEQQLKAAVAGWGRELLAARHKAAESNKCQSSFADYSSLTASAAAGADVRDVPSMVYGQASSRSIASAAAHLAGGTGAVSHKSYQSSSALSSGMSYLDQGSLPLLEHLETLWPAATEAQALMQQVRG